MKPKRDLAEESGITKQEVVARLCALVSKVGKEHFSDDCAHDCFCGQIENDPMARLWTRHFGYDFRMSEAVLVFIESAVDKAIQDEVKPRLSKNSIPSRMPIFRRFWMPSRSRLRTTKSWARCRN